MKLATRTIPYISRLQANILKSMLEADAFSTKDLVKLHKEGKLSLLGDDLSHNTISGNFSTMFYAGIIVRSRTRGYYHLVSKAKTEAIVEHIQMLDWFGTHQHDNLVLNMADLFLRKCSPVNEIVSGKVAVLPKTIGHNYWRTLKDGRFEWLERYETDGPFLNYRLSDECYHRVLVWRDIADLYKQIQNI